MLHYQVESDSPGGATTNSKISELGYYRHVYYTLALMYAKNHIIIFCSLPDIGENMVLDIRENIEWPRFLAHSVISQLCKVMNENIIFLRSGGHVLLINAKFL